MASQQEIELGRLAVARGLVTEEQVLTALRARNQDPAGPDLGALLVARGLVPRALVDALRGAVERGEGRQPPRRPARDELSTEHEISLGGAREAIARDTLEEAQAALATRRDEALRELRRLADEFPDTESGNRARELLAELGA